MGVGIIHFKNSSQLFLLDIEPARESKFRQNNTKYLTSEYNPCALEYRVKKNRFDIEVPLAIVNLVYVFAKGSTISH